MRGLRVGLAYAVVATCLSAAASNAQSRYLEKGTSGFEIAAGYGAGGGVNDLGAGIGYSVKGIFEIGAVLDRLTLDDDNLDTSALQVQPYASVHLLKQSPQVPISIELMGSYWNATYSSDGLDELGWDMSADGFSFGGSVYGAIPASPTVRIIPDVGLSYSSGTLTVEDSFGDSVSDDISGTSVSLGTTLAFGMANGSTFRIRGGAGIPDEGDAMLGLSLGMIFPVGGN